MLPPALALIHDANSPNNFSPNFLPTLKRAIALFGSTSTTATGTSLESDPTYGVTLTKGAGAEGFSGVDALGQTRVSFKDLDVAIAPTPEPSSLLGLVGVGALGIAVCRRQGKGS